MSESTRYTVLGMVRRRPSTYGYALVDEVQKWSGPDGVAPTPRSVYRALHDLSEARLIEPLDKSADLAQEGPNRRRFTTTSEGERRYEQWLQSAPQSSVEFFRRIATARPEDLPVLLDLVIREEHGLLAQHRELRVPEVDKLVSRPAPWGEIIAAFLGSAKLNEVSSQLTFLYSLRRALEELLDKTTDQAPAS